MALATFHMGVFLEAAHRTKEAIMAYGDDPEHRSLVDRARDAREQAEDELAEREDEVES